MNPDLPRPRPRRYGDALRMLALSIVGICGLLAAQAGFAGSLQVAPISVELSAGEQAQALWLSNSGDRPIRAQVRVMKWSQAGGVERLDPSRELMPSPPMLEIAPGQQQLVRLVRPVASPPDQELTYRLIVDELPDPRQERDAGLQFLLQYSVPVFVLPVGATAQDAPGQRPPTDLSSLGFRLEHNGSDAQLVVVNESRRRLRLSQLAHVAADGQRTLLVPGLLGYVLAGQRMQWPVSLPAGGLRGASLMARLNDDQDPQRLPLASTAP